MSVYYDLGRFPYDEDSALYHLEKASECGSLDAILTLSKMYLGMPHDVLTNVELEVSANRKLRLYCLSPCTVLKTVHFRAQRNAVLKPKKHIMQFLLYID